MPHRFITIVLCCLLPLIVPIGCDGGDGAAAPPHSDPLDAIAGEYAPPPEPGPEARAALERGKALVARNDLEEAITQFGQAITLEPRFAQAYLHRARARDAQGAAVLALVDAENAIIHDRRLAEAYHLRAELYERRYYIHNDPADKQRMDDDRARYEQLTRERTTQDLASEVDAALR